MIRGVKRPYAPPAILRTVRVEVREKEALAFLIARDALAVPADAWWLLLRPVA